MKNMNLILFLLFVSITATQDNLEFYKSCTETKPGQGTLNPFCKCKESPAKLFLDNKLRVTPLCLLGSGGIMGSLGGRTLWTPKAENKCVGSPLEIGIARVDENKIIITWAEDQGGNNFDPNKGKIHVTEILNAETNPTMGKDVILNCVYNGGVVITKENKIATLCPVYTATTIVKKTGVPNTENTLDLQLVELDMNLEVLRKVSVNPSQCIDNNEGCFPKLAGEAFRWLKYDPINHSYAYWVNARWGIHVADALIVLDATTLERQCGGDHWSNVGAHTAGTKIAFSPSVNDWGYVGVSDEGASGLIFDKVRRRLYNDRTKNIVTNKLNGQASTTWPGSIISCGDHFYTAFHGIKNKGTDDIDVGIARINAVSGKVEKVTWIVSGDGKNQKSAKIAALSKNCDRFLFGWGTGSVNSNYPSKFYVVEIDRDGKTLTKAEEVGMGTVWYENTEWISLSPGKVGWTTTWRRQNNGNPRVVTMNFNGIADTGDVRATTSDSGYGCQVNWDRSTERFKTNELFVSVYTTQARLTSHTPINYPLIPQTWCCKTGLMKFIPIGTTASCWSNGCSTCVSGGFKYLRYSSIPDKDLTDEQLKKKYAQLGITPPPWEKPAVCYEKTRYVTVRLNHKDYLMLSEVEVIDTSYENVARDKTAKQSSSFRTWLPASKALDGITSGTYHSQSIAMTELEQNPWWTVDLAGDYDVSKVNVYNRADESQEKLSNADVILLNNCKEELKRLNLGNMDGTNSKSLNFKNAAVLEHESLESLE